MIAVHQSTDTVSLFVQLGTVYIPDAYYYSSLWCIWSFWIALLPDLPRDARPWVHTDDPRNVPIPRQSRILPPSPGKILIEIIVRGVGLRCADIGVAFACLCKRLRHSFEERIPGGAGV